MSGVAVDTGVVGAVRGDSSLTPVQQSALRKASWRLIPLLTLAYLFSYLDRTCIGFAALTWLRNWPGARPGCA